MGKNGKLRVQVPQLPTKINPKGSLDQKEVHPFSFHNSIITIGTTFQDQKTFPGKIYNPTYILTLMGKGGLDL